MNPIKWVIAGVGTAIGLAIVIALGVFAWQIKGELHDARVQQATADSARWQGITDALRASLLVRDRAAAETRTVFVQARAAQASKPVVTGGGKVADSIANAAVNACYEKATAALTACEKARATADSLGPAKDSLADARRRLASLSTPGRWTARGSVLYAWPMKSPMIRAESEIKIMRSISITGGADYLLMKSPSTPTDSIYAKQKWRYYIGASIPFR